MIARHSYEQSGDGEGVEVIENRDWEDNEHGKGQYTEKRIHLSTYVRYIHIWYIPKDLSIKSQFQATTILATSNLPQTFLCNRKIMELLSVHNNW